MLLRFIFLVSEGYWREEIPGTANEAYLNGETPKLWGTVTGTIAHLIRRAC
jgi:hypothetical protein